MTATKKADGFSTHLTLYAWLVALLWTGCVAASLLWNLHEQADKSLKMARKSAQLTFENDVLYRRWASRQGGVYVRVSESTLPNPYLQVPDRDVTTTAGESLTLVNPAYMARLVHELASQEDGTSGHITSLRPIRPENGPDEWETAALQEFEKGTWEVSSVEKMGDGEYLRLMRPFVTEKACLKCHAAQGYQEGDIRGGISVSVPMAPLRAIEKPMTGNLELAHAALWMAGLAGIGISKRGLGKQMLARGRVEADLRASEEKYRELVELSPQALFVNRDNRIEFVNPAALRLFGAGNAGEVLGKSPFDLFHPDCHPVMTARIRTLHEGQSVPLIKERILRLDGAIRDVEVVAAPFVDQEGAAIQVILQDITDRKRAEDELHREKAFADSVIDSLPGAFYLFDSNGRFLRWNKNFEMVTGYSSAELAGMEPWDFFRGGDRDRIRAAVQRVFETGEVTIEADFVSKDGRTTPYYFTGIRVELAQGRCLAGVGLDVSERKRAEQELRQRTAELEDKSRIADLASLFVRDLQGRVVYWNTGARQLYGFTKEEAVGQVAHELLQTVFAEPLEHIEAKLLSAGRWEAELTHTRRDGTKVTVSSYWVLHRDAKGRPQAVLEVNNDITATKEAERALRELNDTLEHRVVERTAELHRSNAYNRSLLEASLDPLVTIAADGKITDVNAATEKATGRSRRGLIGTDFSNYFTEPDKARAGYQQVFRDGFVQDYALEIQHPDGHRTPVLYNASVYHDEAGKVIGVFAAARDITEQKRAEEAVRLERQRLHQLFERLPVYVALLTPDYHLPYANRFFRERFGEARGRRCYEYLFGRTEPCEVCETFTVLKTRQPHTWEWTGPDGRDYDIFDFPFTDSDGSTLIMEMGIDVTEQKRLQSELLRMNEELEQHVAARTAELQASNKELEAFAYSVSHDLRAPLRAMDGFSQALLEDYADVLHNEGKDHLQRIRAASQRMADLIDGILGLSRTTRSEMRRATVNMSALVQTVAAELQKTEPARRVEFVIAPDLLVNADANLLRIMLGNLLTNSWKFTSKHPQARIEFGATEQDGEQVYFVRDDGAGFDMRYMDNLFGAFRRLHSSAEFEGTGVGLATVQRVVHRHGGRVWAEGQVEKGATFFFTIPGGVK